MRKTSVPRARVLAPLLLASALFATVIAQSQAQPNAAQTPGAPTPGASTRAASPKAAEQKAAAKATTQSTAAKSGAAQAGKQKVAPQTKSPTAATSAGAKSQAKAKTGAAATSMRKIDAPATRRNSAAKTPANKSSVVPASAKSTAMKTVNPSAKSAAPKKSTTTAATTAQTSTKTATPKAAAKPATATDATTKSVVKPVASGATPKATPQKTGATGATPSQNPPRVLAKTQVVALPKTVSFANGAKLVLRPDRAAPLVVISLLVRAGAADENAATAGWRRLLMETMLRASSAQGLDEKVRGSATAGFLSGTQLQTRADELGGRIGASVGDDAIEIWASGPSENAAELTDLLLAVALRPRLDERDVAFARDRLLLRGDDAQDDPSSVATTALRTQLYRDSGGRAAAYALPLFGTEATLASLSREQLRDFHARFFVPSRFVIAAAGDIDEAALSSRFSSLAANAAGVPSTAPFLAPLGRNEPPLVVRQVPSNQAWVFVSYRVAEAASADLPALRVLAAALGEARGARLPNRLLGSAAPAALSPARRRATASASQVSVSFTPRRLGTEFIALAQTDAARVEDVKNAMLDEIRKLRDAPLSPAEFSRARDFVLGSFATERETLRERAYLAALWQSYAPQNPASTRGAVADLGWPSLVAKVTRADVQRVARKYLTNYAVALLMPSE